MQTKLNKQEIVKYIHAQGKEGDDKKLLTTMNVRELQFCQNNMRITVVCKQMFNMSKEEKGELYQLYYYICTLK